MSKVLNIVTMAAVLLLCACAPTMKTPITKNGFMLDTVITATLYSGGSDEVLQEAFDLCAAYEQIFSRTDRNSELYKLNHADGAVFPVSKDLLAVLERAIYYSGLTGGRYDVTICPVADLWDFTSGTSSLPDSMDLDRALAKVGWENIVIEGDTVRLLRDAQVDLGSIAKGYIADRMADYLREHGVSGAIINLGGNIVTVGTKPDGEAFRIGVQNPSGVQGETIGTIEVANRSVVSSGTYERSFVMDGTLYHHILDVDTGYPADTGLAGVTVISDLSADADALSTCLFLLGPEEGISLAETLGIEAVFIDEQGVRRYTSGFQENLHFKTK